MPFRDTRLGRILYVYAPVEYHLLMRWMGGRGGCKSTRDRFLFSVQELTGRSGNPIFKTGRFHKAVIHYRRYGCAPPEKARWTLQDVLYFARYSYTTHKEMERCAD